MARLASGTRLRFKNPIDPIGGPLVGLIAAWVLTSFTIATLHTSPMGKDAFSGKLVYTDSEVASSSGLTCPDLAWLRFVQHVSQASAFGSASTTTFTAKGFVQIYEKHRTQFGTDGALRVRRG